MICVDDALKSLTGLPRQAFVFIGFSLCHGEHLKDVKPPSPGFARGFLAFRAS